MDSVKYCEACFCLCWMVSAECIVSLSELTNTSVIKTSDINNTNSDVAELLGELCFQELCEALTQATKDANTYNEDELNTEKKTALDFLAAKWVSVVTNMYFKSWYANRVAWWWFEGSSITQLKKVGLITTSNEDEEFKNGFKHAEEAQRKRLAAVSERTASNYKNKFKEFFWDLPENAKNYSCRPGICCDSQIELGESIGMSSLK